MDQFMQLSRLGLYTYADMASCSKRADVWYQVLLVDKVIYIGAAAANFGGINLGILNGH